MKALGWDGMYTLKDDSGEEVRRGYKLSAEYILDSGRAPHKENSSGRVFTKCGCEFFPHVFDLKWHRNES